MDTLAKILLLLQQQDKTQKQLTDFLGIQKGTFTKWKNGENESFKKHISKIAEFFNVSTDYLLGKSDSKKAPPFENESALSDEVISIAERVMKLDPELRKQATDYLAFLTSRQNPEIKK